MNFFLKNKLIIAGILLLSINLLGLFIKPAPEFPQEGVPGYSYPVIDTDKLWEFYEEEKPRRPGLKWLREANRTVYFALAHSAERRVKFYENYLLWLGGFIYEPLRTTQSMNRIVEGQEAICSEAAQVLMDIAEEAGLSSRFVHLGGHIVLEVYIDDRWYVADPDYGVVYEKPLKVLEARRGSARIRKRLAERGFSEESIEHVIKIFQESDNNWRMPEGQALSPRLYAIEVTAEYLKWIFPGILLLAGIKKEKVKC